MKRIVVRTAEDIDRILGSHQLLTLLGVHCSLEGDNEKWVICYSA